LFRGRVTDANNNALPFANVTIQRDNIGTYADAKGNFTLVSSDTVLNVEVRSVGFQNNFAQLQTRAADNQIVLQEDRSLQDRVLSYQKADTNRSRKANIKFEEPEPADGWSNYDTYIANNLKVPDDAKSKETFGEVLLSFEVDKNGNPVNIKVEKSLSKECDREAIRLVKQGPKWKKKGKKGRAVVTVPFQVNK
jgi:TonB family protein